MRRKRDTISNYYAFHSEQTDPALTPITSPITFQQMTDLPPSSIKTTGSCLFMTIRKLSQLLALGLAVLLLLLFTRFLLRLFEIKASLFTRWVFLLTTPPILPFDNLLPTLHFNGMTLDAVPLVAILVYTIVYKLLRCLLRILAD